MGAETLPVCLRVGFFITSNSGETATKQREILTQNYRKEIENKKVEPFENSSLSLTEPDALIFSPKLDGNIIGLRYYRACTYHIGKIDSRPCADRNVR